MIPVDNIVFMKENFPLVWDAYRETESQQNLALVEIIPSRVEAFPTLCLYGEDRDTFLHSRYNPLREAQTIVKGLKNVEEYEHVIFYGTGLGYHIRELLERCPHLSFSIYEPVPEVFAAFLAHNELKSLPVRHLHEIVVETRKDAELSSQNDCPDTRKYIIRRPAELQDCICGKISIIFRTFQRSGQFPEDFSGYRFCL